MERPSGSLRVILPNRGARSEDRRRPVPPLLRRVAARRRARLQHHGQRASSDRDLHVVDGDRRRCRCWRARPRSARILVLGYPIGHRPDPLRCAEELATIDVVSRGRLDMGFIKGVPYEFPASNQNPVGVMDRFWEAHDFIIKAMTSHDEPFNWEGEYFHYRQVNIWPRPVQQPHPPVWTTTGNQRRRACSARRAMSWRRSAPATPRARSTTPIAPAISRSGRSPRRPTASPISASSRSPTTRPRRAAAASSSPAICAHRRSCSAVPQSAGLPLGRGQCPHAARPERRRAASPRTAASINMHHGSVQDLIDAGIMFCGTPDQVYEQIVDFTRILRRHGQSLDDGPGRLPHARGHGRQPRRCSPRR